MVETGAVMGAAVSHYDCMRRVYELAVEHASKGKGKERHETPGDDYTQQQAVVIGRWLGSIHFELGQAIKKAAEAARLPPERAKPEILGSMNYLNAAFLLLEEMTKGKP
jgi:hypothetical protein